MLGITLEESRVYQDAKVEGIFLGERKLVICQLNHKLGKIPQAVLTKIEALSSEQLEELGKALLDFSTVANLQQWLNSRLKPVKQE